MKKEILKQFTESAEGSSIEVHINYVLPSVTVRRPEDGEEWHFQEHSASELLASIPEEIHPEIWLKVVAKHW